MRNVSFFNLIWFAETFSVEFILYGSTWSDIESVVSQPCMDMKCVTWYLFIYFICPPADLFIDMEMRNGCHNVIDLPAGCSVIKCGTERIPTILHLLIIINCWLFRNGRPQLFTAQGMMESPPPPPFIWIHQIIEAVSAFFWRIKSERRLLCHDCIIQNDGRLASATIYKQKDFYSKFASSTVMFNEAMKIHAPYFPEMNTWSSHESETFKRGKKKESWSVGLMILSFK